MPHQPRKLPNTTGIPAELTQPPREHPPIPLRLGAKEPRDDKPARQRLGLDSISPRTYEPDYAQVYRTLFGRDMDVDKYTGGLVHPAGRAAPPRPGPQQAGPAQPK